MSTPETASDTPPAPEPVKSTETASPVPPAAPAVPSVPADLEKDIKQRLEYEIMGNEVSVRIQGRKLTFKKWGLRKNLKLGSKILRLVTRIKTLLPDDTDFSDVAVFSQVLSVLADDVLDIIAASLSAPFTTEEAAEFWLDENITSMEDLFDLAYIVYEQNLKGEALGKLTGGMEGLAKKVNSLSMSSSKN